MLPSHSSPRALAPCLVLCLALATAPPASASQSHDDGPSITTSGTGPDTWVLLSGLVGGVTGFRRLESLLVDRGYRVVVIDPYRLSIDSADVSFAAMARRVDAVLTSLGVERARIVGHAHGAGVALRLATADPQRVSSLFFIDVGALVENRSKVLAGSLRFAPVVARLPGGRRYLRQRFLGVMRESACRQDWLDGPTQQAYTEPVLRNIDRVVALARRMSRSREPDSLPALLALLARLDVPITLILGDASHRSGPEPEELVALAPLGALVRTERLPGVGHFPHEEAPGEVVRILLMADSTRQIAQAGVGR